MLRLPDASLPERQLQEAWRALDDDNSGFITAGEFGRFMRLGKDRCVQYIVEQLPGGPGSLVAAQVVSSRSRTDPREEDRRYRREVRLMDQQDKAARYLDEAARLEEIAMTLVAKLPVIQ